MMTTMTTTRSKQKKQQTHGEGHSVGDGQMIVVHNSGTMSFSSNISLSQEDQDMSTIRQELDSLSDPMRKDVSSVQKKIDSANKEMKALEHSGQKKERECKEAVEAFNEKNKEKEQHAIFVRHRVGHDIARDINDIDLKQLMNAAMPFASGRAPAEWEKKMLNLVDNEGEEQSVSLEATTESELENLTKMLGI